jgi:hypothetical protein
MNLTPCDRLQPLKGSQNPLQAIFCGYPEKGSVFCLWVSPRGIWRLLRAILIGISRPAPQQSTFRTEALILVNIHL